MRVKGNIRKASLFKPEIFPIPNAENRKKYLIAKL